MKMKRLLVGSLVICGVLASVLPWVKKAVSATESADHNLPDEASYDKVEAYVRQQMDRLNIPGASFAIVEGDEIVHMRGLGRARPGGEAPAPQTPFAIGSLTKSFTALATMQIVEAGKIDLDAPVQRYLPWFRVADPQASAQITVRHLLNQTSGLSTTSGWIPLADFDNHPGAIERRVRALSTVELVHPVGTAFEYSDANYNVLGLIIEVVSGETYADYVRRHIFVPLDMHHSTTSRTQAQQDGMAVGHRLWFWFPSAVPDLPAPEGSLPSGQLLASAEDMAHYVIAMLNGGRYGDAQLLSEAGVAALHRGVAEHVAMGMSMGKYGMGWYASDIGETKVIWHTGLVPDFSAYMGLLPEQQRGVILLLNADHFMMEPVLAEVGAGSAALLAGEQPEPVRLGFIPWMMRSLLLIPALQMVGVVTTVRRLRRWRQNPASCPDGGRLWGRHILLPLIPHLLVVLTLIPLLGPMRGFWRLFMPDYTWIATICGSFAGVWAFLRTGLVLRALRRPERYEGEVMRSRRT
jgi:CubicO group peptidase (beta-lactamase class C family)